MSGRPWTPAELAAVRRLYGTVDADEIGRRVRRTRRAVHLQARKLGLSRWPRWSPAVVRRLQSLHAKGLPDRSVAARMRDVFGAGTRGHDRAKGLRRRLGLPCHPDLEGKRLAVATQMARLGIRPGGALRALAFRRFARASGWPEDLRPREVQILNVLAEHGPRTRRELAAAIGMRTDLRNPGRGGQPILKSNGPSGTYTADLARRGLVLRQKRWTTGRGHGKNRLPDLYILTAKAVAIREECLERLQRERDRAAAAAAADADPAGRGRGGARPQRGRGVGRPAPGRGV